jgi:type III restriction enzyme
VIEGDVTVGHLLFTEVGAQAVEKIRNGILSVPGSIEPVLLPLLRRFDDHGSTDEVRFPTRKVVMDPPPVKSPLNHVVLDGARGNSWEEGLARLLERDDRVRSYVKNERLGFTIPYVHQGRSHDYVPDFLVRLETETSDAGATSRSAIRSPT